MNKKSFAFYFILPVIFGFYFLITNPVFASTTASAAATSGVDVSGVTSSAFSASDLTKLAVSDDTRILSNGPWPSTGSYNENKYLEFNFLPNIPPDAIIESVSIANEFRRSGALTETKLEVWDGSTFTNKILTVGAINIDHTDTIDIAPLINTASKVNNLKIRFLAFRGSGANTTTSHDFIGLSVTYSIPVPSNDTNPPPSNTNTSASDTLNTNPPIPPTTPDPIPPVVAGLQGDSSGSTLNEKETAEIISAPIAIGSGPLLNSPDTTLNENETTQTELASAVGSEPDIVETEETPQLEIIPLESRAEIQLSHVPENTATQTVDTVSSKKIIGVDKIKTPKKIVALANNSENETPVNNFTNNNQKLSAINSRHKTGFWNSIGSFFKWVMDNW